MMRICVQSRTPEAELNEKEVLELNYYLRKLIFLFALLIDAIRLRYTRD